MKERTRLWSIVVYGVAVALNRVLHLGLDDETLLALGALIGLYIVGRSAEKTAKAASKGRAAK